MTGVTHNFGGIVACRLFIGLPEAAFYPGVIYLLSRWYTKKELAFRSSIFFTGLLTSNAFGTLMAAGVLSGMEGKLGIRAWRWLFFIEVPLTTGRSPEPHYREMLTPLTGFVCQGAITMFVGLVCIWLLPDYPHNTRWITGQDRRLAQARLAEDAGEADQDSESESFKDGNHGCQGPSFGCLKHVPAARPELHQLLPHVGIPTLVRPVLVDDSYFTRLTATLGFNTTISLLLAA
ncbi:hypothetical protein PM082_016725 [Marasmius tenuissimus]|nr:hypothetical protein PM082_016725 [Marasmius tenuissimus]